MNKKNQVVVTRETEREMVYDDRMNKSKVLETREKEEVVDDEGDEWSRQDCGDEEKGTKALVESAHGGFNPVPA